MAPRDIEYLLPQLLSFPPHPPPPLPLSDQVYDKEIKTLRLVLNEIPGNALTGGVPNGGDLLDILDPSINTLPYLYVLLAHIHAGKQKVIIGESLWQKTSNFLERFDPVQVRYVGVEFRRIILFMRDTALVSNRPIAAVRPIRSAILRLDPSSSCFTSTHLIFVRLCLQASTFRAAKPVIDKDLYEFPSVAKTHPSGQLPCSQHDTSSGFITDQTELSGSLSYRDVLQYFFYGAMVYMALREWNRALLFLEIVLTAPTKSNASQIQVEAYKKWVLANLLARGEVPGALPKTTSPQVAKNVRALGRPYEALGEIFKDGLAKEQDVRRLNAEIHTGHPQWLEDHNLSLVLQVLDAYRQFSIARLELTYAALPLLIVTQRTSRDPEDHAETAQYVAMMISKGQLNAALDKRSQDPQSWILRFATSSTGPQARSEQEQYEELVEQASRTAKLADHVRETDRKLSLSKEYINWMKQAKNESNAPQGEDSSMSSRLPFDEEDIMGDG
ncbi:MAG: hypothetical protein LQ345_006027 [Seirophora villosa]|nr:MAG: hypothetical protein LQ345_006027 [Seirophora villosa]